MLSLRNRFDSTRANLVWATAIQVIEKFAGYLVIAVLTRTLTTVEIGEIFFASTISGIAATVLSFGTEHHLMRGVAEQPARAVQNLGEVLALRLQNMVLVYGVVNLACWVLDPSLAPVLMLVTAYDFLEEIYFAFSQFFAGTKQLIYRLVIQGIVELLTLAAVSAVAYLTASVYAVLATYLVVDIGLVVGTYLVVRRDFGAIPLRWDWQKNIGLMRLYLPFFIFNILTLVHLRLDTLMVGILLNLVQVAYYDLGMQMLEVARFVIRPFNSVFYPLFSEMAAQGRWSELRRRAVQLTGAALILGLLASIGMLVLGGPVIVFLFGASYEPSVAPTRILFLSTPFIYMHFILTILANALHLERQSAWLLAGSALLNFALNLFVIPRYGIIGAAWTTLASQLVLALSILWLTASRLLKASSA